MLTSKLVNSVFLDCLFKESEQPDNAVIVEGIVAKIGFNPDKLKSHESDIIAMLDELPVEFRSDGGGGGWSFLNACMDKNGEQWTGFHEIMDQLFCLGMAIGKVKCQLSRELWSVLPGGMPYYVYYNTKE